MFSIQENLNNIKEKSGLTVSLKSEDEAGWNSVMENVEYLPVTYTHEENNYQLLYQKSKGKSLVDISLVIYNDKTPCAIWPLAIYFDSKGNEISTFGLPVCPPLFIDSLSKKTIKKLFKKNFLLIDYFCESLTIKNWSSIQSFNGKKEVGLTNWHEEMVRHGASLNVTHDLFIDLTLDLSTIKSTFRKSYKPLINKGLKLWGSGVLDANSDSSSIGIWNNFRKLHEKAAGKVTRSDESWMAQLDSINNNKAFFIYLLNEKNEMVGGSYFSYTRHEGRYDVAAYDRSLFESPLGHVVQYKAIEKLKKEGVQWYKIGKRPYNSDVLTPSEKEIAIGEFKEGFSTHLLPEYLYMYQRS